MTFTRTTTKKDHIDIDLSKTKLVFFVAETSYMKEVFF